MDEFDDAAILVTGSTRGIGVAIARELSAAGALVGIHGGDAGRGRAVCEELTNAVALPGDLDYPAEVAGAGAFLLSPAAAYVTGQVLRVNGGLWMQG